MHGACSWAQLSCVRCPAVPCRAAPTGAAVRCRFACGPEGMHRDVVLRYVEASTQLLVPFTPHTSEHIWWDGRAGGRMGGGTWG